MLRLFGNSCVEVSTMKERRVDVSTPALPAVRREDPQTSQYIVLQDTW